MSGELYSKVVEGEEGVGIVETFLVFPVAAFDLAVMARGIRANELVADAQRESGGFKERREKAIGIGEAVGELKAVVSLNTFNADPAPGEPSDCLPEEVSGGEGGLLLIGSEEAEAGELVDGGILKETQRRIGDTTPGNDLHVDLDPLARMGHLFIRLGHIPLLLLRRREHSETMQHSVQRIDMTCISPLSQPVP